MLFFAVSSKEKLLLRTMILTFRYKVIALHSILSTQDQAAAFTFPPQGVRKVKLSTSNLYVIHLRTVHENDSLSSKTVIKCPIHGRFQMLHSLISSKMNPILKFNLYLYYVRCLYYVLSITLEEW